VLWNLEAFVDTNQVRPLNASFAKKGAEESHEPEPDYPEPDAPKPDFPNRRITLRISLLREIDQADP
jgi:hypothetical protein